MVKKGKLLKTTKQSRRIAELEAKVKELRNEKAERGEVIDDRNANIKDRSTSWRTGLTR